MYPKSNGKVENAVKTAKRLMKKAKHSENDAHLALLDYRNSPTEGIGLSPAQVMFGRRTTTLLPISKRLLMPETRNTKKQYNRLLKNKNKQAKYYNKNAKDKQQLKLGDIVRVSPVAKHQPWKKARVETEEGIRSYRIKTEDGSSYRRNRIHLRGTNEPFQEESLESQIEKSPSSESSVSNESEIKSPSALCNGKLKSPRVEKQISVGKSSDESAKIKCSQVNVNENIKLGNREKKYSRESSERPQTGNRTEYQTKRGRTIKKPTYLQEFQT